MIQNNAARLVLQRSKSCHVTPLLQQLHWLPIEQRIKYKILLLVFKCLHNKAPVYLSSLLTIYTPPRSLRSVGQQLLHIPPSHKKYGDRSFTVSGPKLWNSLPIVIRNSPSLSCFKTSIKTYLFKEAFNLE